MGDVVELKRGARDSSGEVVTAFADDPAAGSRSSDAQEKEPSPFVLIPGVWAGSCERFALVPRGSRAHWHFFRFLKNKDKLNMWLSAHPDFLPLKGSDEHRG